MSIFFSFDGLMVDLLQGLNKPLYIFSLKISCWPPTKYLVIREGSHSIGLGVRECECKLLAHFFFSSLSFRKVGILLFSTGVSASLRISSLISLLNSGVPKFPVPQIVFWILLQMIYPSFIMHENLISVRNPIIQYQRIIFCHNMPPTRFKPRVKSSSNTRSSPSPLLIH